jgi:hypothetical protein
MHGASDPAVQASYMKNLLSGLERRELAAGLAGAAPEVGEQVAAAGRLTWLPVDLNVRAVGWLCETLGEDRALHLLADCVHEQFDTPLWKNFVTGAVRLLGKDPGDLGRWIPKAFSLVFRDCGAWNVLQSGECELTLVLSDIPASLVGERRWLRSLGVGMQPLFTVCGETGTSDLAAIDPATRVARYELSWKPAQQA